MKTKAGMLDWRCEKMGGFWNHVAVSELWYQTCCDIRKISPHFQFAVIRTYCTPDTFAFRTPGIHREATLGELPQSLPLFSELCLSPHSCPYLPLREFLLGSSIPQPQLIDSVGKPDTENFNWAQKFIQNTQTGKCSHHGPGRYLLVHYFFRLLILENI